MVLVDLKGVRKGVWKVARNSFPGFSVRGAKAKLITGRWGMQKMHQTWACAMGHTVHAESDDDLVRKAQEHMRKEHGQSISREEVLKAAKKG